MKNHVFTLIISIFLLMGCSSLVQRPENRPDPAQLASALAGEVILGEGYAPSELPQADLFGLTAEMRQFAETATAGIVGAENKTEALHRELMSQSGRAITYSAYTTNTGISAFEERQANCLSYTLLFVAMARHIGLNAQYNEVSLPPTWDMRDDQTYLYLRHVNARVVATHRQFGFVREVGVADVSDVIVDLELSRYRATYEQHFISRDEMAALYYSNRGMELAAEGDAQAGFLYLRKALLLNPQASYIWSNLGSFYRRVGQLPQAEAAYLQGLVVDEEDPSVLYNLAGLYDELGQPQRSQYFQARVQRHRAANPFYQYHLASELVNSQQDFTGARRYIEKAIALEKHDIRFYRLAREIYVNLGDSKKATAMAAKIAAMEQL